jgi:formylglycine-generating enzyme required for sulfatase activity
VRARYTKVPRTTLWLVAEASFAMGGDGPDEAPRRLVSAGPFYIGKAPITNAQYAAFDPGHGRAASSPGDDDPVVGVGFRDAVAYCAWYSDLSGKAFRLPTEAEWELACRGGTAGRWFWGESEEAGDAYVWDGATSGGRAHEVETRRGNPLGLHDMLGNAWEWTGTLASPADVGGPGTAESLDLTGPRILRGGSFRTPRRELGCAVRRLAPEDLRADDVGFRILRPHQA